MYAVIKTGGKQYRVSEGQKLRVEKLPGSAGDKITFGEVLLVSGDTPKESDDLRDIFNDVIARAGVLPFLGM